MKVLVNQLKLHRSRMGLTQEEVAASVGVSRQAVAKWEKGDTLPDLESCVKLADLFRIPLDMLVRGLSEKKEQNGQKQLFGCVKMNEKGQITLPAQVREAFGLESGDLILVLADTEKGIALAKVNANDTEMVIPPVQGYQRSKEP